MTRVKVPGGEIQPVDPEVMLTRSQPSVLIKLDSKGVFSYEVKAYADTMEEALAQAVMGVNYLENRKLGKAPDED